MRTKNPVLWFVAKAVGDGYSSRSDGHFHSKSDAVALAKKLAQETGDEYIIYKPGKNVYERIKNRHKNPASTWFKLDHPHALAVVDNEIQLMSSKKLTNPQKKKFKSFVTKVRRALSK